MIIQIDTVKFSDRIFSEYGLAMLLAIAVIVVVYRLYMAKSKAYDDLVEKVMTSQQHVIALFAKVEQRLNDQEKMKEVQAEVLALIKQCREDHAQITNLIQKQ